MGVLLVGEKVNLRPLRNSDSEALCRHANDRLIHRFTFVPYPYLPEHARQFLKYCRMQLRKDVGLHLGIEDKATGQIIGVVGLEGIDRHHRKAEIGYWLGREYRRQGMTSEAVTLMLKYAFTELKMKRICAKVLPGNTASEELLLRLGFMPEGVERASHYRRGRWLSCTVYSILRDEFRTKRAPSARSLPSSERTR